MWKASASCTCVFTFGLHRLELGVPVCVGDGTCPLTEPRQGQELEIGWNLPGAEENLFSVLFER